MSNIIFKIYGERNSGTCFLTHLLWKNFPNTYTFEHLCNNNVIRYWKHGIPTESIEHCYPHKRKIKIFYTETWKVG